MKTKSLFPCRGLVPLRGGRSRVLPALIAVLNLIQAVLATAQTFATLHSFTALGETVVDEEPFYVNSDGANPSAGLILSGSTLYGTTELAGPLGSGTLFAVNTDGTGFTNLHIFAQRHYFGGYVPDENSDGMSPNGLILSGQTLYGTAGFGGWSGGGTLFAVNTDGTGFTNLHNFTTESHPEAGLILSGNTLYGTAQDGGNYGCGTVFAINTNGTGFTNLHSFNYAGDGANPQASLILSGNTLYGTAYGGGSSSFGTVFAVNTNGTGFTNLHTFAGSDGNGPYAGLVLAQGFVLYGTTLAGGSAGYGTVFAYPTNVTIQGFGTVHSFTASSTNASGVYTNSDGVNPEAGLILSGYTLYGTASGGGSSGYGTVFALYPGFTTLHSFTGGSDGASPQAGLVLSGNTLYGTAAGGGSSGNGTVFSLSFRPQLTITPSGTNVILTWPANVAGFDYTGYRLQRANAITGLFADVPGSSSPYFVPITSPQQFFRLVQ
jgi:uncharacterized repeat protein (TIGR03803 family)